MPLTASTSPTTSEQTPAGLMAGIVINGRRAIETETLGGDRPAGARSQSSSGREHSRVEKLLKADRLKDQLLATVCHELRSPLASIQNAIDILRKPSGEDPSVRGKMLELIERQAQQMSSLSTSLLDASKFAIGHMHLQRNRIDLRAVLCNALETLESDFERHGQRLLAVWPDSSVWVSADAGRLEQVFVNLLTNASKYSNDEGEIVLSMHDCNEAVEVRVRDSGIGIAPEMLPHIFELFMQVDPAAPRSRSGLGVGLSLVRALVQSHGGSVTAESAGLGQGSEFIVRLPCEPSECESKEGSAPLMPCSAPSDQLTLAPQ
jgi:signal transduction histidine kinase